MIFDASEETESENDGVEVSGRFIAVLTIGFAIVIAGFALIIISSLVGGGSANVGGVIFIGPFPIVFGAGPDAIWLVLISLVISVVMIVIFVLMRRKV